MPQVRSDEQLIELLISGADDFDQLAHSVGYFVLLWANAEQWLDMCVAVLYRGLGGNVRVKRMPKSLQPRLDFMEECFGALPVLSPLRGRARKVVSGFKKLTSIRHELVHGAIRDPFISGTKYRFCKFDLVDGRIHKTRTFTLELSRQAPALRDRVLVLEQRTMDLFYRLHQLWKRELLKEVIANAKGASTPRFVDLSPDEVLMRKRRSRAKSHQS